MGVVPPLLLRSMLFVPADSERKLAKAASAGADALILDLEDSVLPDRKEAARGLAQDYLRHAPADTQIWVRVNDLGSGDLLRDLHAVVHPHLAGVVLPKIRGPEDVLKLTHYLEAMEEWSDRETAIPILPIITETPSAVLRMEQLVSAQPGRMSGVSWGAEDLSSALGAGDPRLPGGGWRPLYEHVRSQCILVAHALAIAAIDTVYVDFRNQSGLQAACAASRYDGFTGRFAIHPDQVALINEAFTPSDSEVQLAHRIVAAFETGAGAVSLDGKMYDVPHLKAARRLIATHSSKHVARRN